MSHSSSSSPVLPLVPSSMSILSLNNRVLTAPLPTTTDDNPPKLPPKRQRVNTKTPIVTTTPPSSPKLLAQNETYSLPSQNNLQSQLQKQLTQQNASPQQQYQHKNFVGHSPLLVNELIDDKTGNSNNAYIRLPDGCVVYNNIVKEQSHPTQEQQLEQSKQCVDNNNHNNAYDEEQEVVFRHQQTCTDEVVVFITTNF